MGADGLYNDEPVCDLTEEGGSPSGYCKFGIRNFCATAIDMAHFPSACSDTGGELHGGDVGTEMFFDQFALERTMLGKWLSHPDSYGWRVPAKGSESDESEVHGHIIVPSYLFHCLSSHRKEGTAKWDYFLDGHHDGYRKYWRRIQEMLDYFRDSRSLIVIHSSFTPDTQVTKAMFDTLAEQPPDFVSRVVIASLESNLKTGHKRQLFDAMVQEAQQRRQQLKAEDFARSSHGYDGQRVRPISVLLFGLSNRRNPSAIPTRNALWHQLRQAGAVVPEGSGEETPSLMMCAEGVDCGNMQWKSLFDQTANSAFCLQPAGDTLTRSHFYLSILSGR